MRRYWQERPSTRTFRGAELPRLLTGLAMLAVLFMLIVRAGDPSTWRWLVSDGGKRPAGATAAPADNRPKNGQENQGRGAMPADRERQGEPPALPISEATGPTDEDPDQADAAREDFQALTDGRLSLHKEEMVPYYRLVEWVKNQSFARLDRRARRDLWYTHLHDSPGMHRGQLVALDVDVRRADNMPAENPYGIDLREVWAATEESRGACTH